MQAWLDHKIADGLLTKTVDVYRDALLTMLGDCLGKPLRHLTGRGESLYRRAQRDGKGEPYAPATHQLALGRAREMGRWLVKERWLRANPWAEVEAVGKRATGADKVRLTVDESRRLDAWCLGRLHDQNAVLTLAYLLLGARASELCRRDVRDLDAGGTMLRIGKTKTEAGRRPLSLPPELRTALLNLTAGRGPADPIFTNMNGARMTRSVALKRVLKCCEAAGITPVSPQALRRTNADLAYDAGVVPQLISQHLGHSVAAAAPVTTRNYAGRGTAEVDRARRALASVAGGRREPYTTTDTDTILTVVSDESSSTRDEE